MRHARYKLKNMYDVANVWSGYKYWYDKLLAYCLNIFEYKGLPTSLPAKEVESNLLITGHCVTFVPKKRSDIYTCFTDLSGFDEYYNPTKATYAQPKLGAGTLTLGENAVIIYNSDLQFSVLGQPIDGGLSTYLSRYARQLSDLESTINIKTVNERAPFMATADKDNVKDSVVDFFRKIILGERAVVTDSSIVPNLNAIDIGGKNSNEKIIDVILARDKILEQFYREIGVRFYQSKRAQVNTEEVSANNDMLLISLDDMLLARQEGIDKVNDMFGTSISVSINPAFIPKEPEEGQENVNTDNNTRSVE